MPSQVHADFQQDSFVWAFFSLVALNVLGLFFG
jgi:hypothetical protein